MAPQLQHGSLHSIEPYFLPFAPTKGSPVADSRRILAIMFSTTHAQDTHSIHDLLVTVLHLTDSLRTTQKWDVRDDRTTAALVKCRKGLPLLRPDHPLLATVLLIISDALKYRFEALGEIADINDSIIFLGEFLTILPSSQDGSIDDEKDLHTAAEALSVLGNALTSRLRHSKNVEDLDAAIDNCCMALALSSPDNPTHLQSRVKPVGVLIPRFKEHKRREDLDEAIQLQRESVSSSQTEPDEDDTCGSLALRLSHLGTLLALRYTKFSLIVDLEEVTESYALALALLPNNNERRPDYLRALSECLHLTFEAKGQIEDIDGAIDRLQEAIACLLGGNDLLDEAEILGSLAPILNLLKDLLISRHPKLGLIVDLEQATESYEKALALLPNNDEMRHQYLRDLAVSLHSTFKAKGQIEDLDGAIDRMREALACLSNLEEATESYALALALLPNNDERRPDYLRALSECLHLTFEAKGQIEDIDGAIDRLQEVIACLLGGNDLLDEAEILGSLAPILNLLGDLLISRHRKLGLIVDLEQATESYEKALALLPNNDERRHQYLRALSECLHSTFKAKGQIEDLDGAVDRMREALACLSNLEEATESYALALALLPNNDERRPDYLRALSECLHLTFEAKGQIEDIDGAIDRLREAIACLLGWNDPLDEAKILGFLAPILNVLGDLLIFRHRRLGLIVDLEQATESYEKALALLPNNDEMRHQYLRALAVSLHLTFEAKGQIEDLDGAIDRTREAIAYLSGRNIPLDEAEILGSLAPILNLLGDLLISRHRKLGLIVDLEQATESYEKALVLLPANDQRQPRYLGKLAESLRLTFREKGQIEDLDGAIDRMREALACLSNGIDPADKGETCIFLGFLANILDARFRCTRERADLDEAIRCQYQAMELDPTKRYSALDNLSNHFYTLYLVTRDLSGLERALGFSREALELWPADDSFTRLRIKHDMALYLEERFQRSDCAQDLEEALKIRRELAAVTEGKDVHHKDALPFFYSLHNQIQLHGGQLSASGSEGIQQLRDLLQTATDRTDRIVFLRGLIMFLQDRYAGSRAPEDLEEAIRYLRELTALIPRGYVDHTLFLPALASALHSRFQLFGRIDDIDDAVDSAREAVKMVRSSYRRDCLVQRLSILRKCLTTRSRGSGDIGEAIAICRELVSLSPDDGPALCHLAVAILHRQKGLIQDDDIEEAIILLRKSLALTPEGHPIKLTSLAALWMSARLRCERGGGIECQEEALELFRENVAAYNQFASDDVHFLGVDRLAHLLWIKGDYEKAFIRYEQAANMRYAHPRYRFRVTAWWASRAMRAGHSSSLRAHTKALELLDQCLTSTPTIDLQHQFLTNSVSGSASDAAACAIEKEELEVAVQVLEQGRALLWSRMRSYRPSMEELQESHPGLAQEFKGVCQQLEHLTVSSEPDLPGMTPLPISTSRYAAHSADFDAKITKNRQLLEDYERIISEIRQLEGFSSFLQATPFSTLQTAASEGPVILVNVNKHRSDVIILREADVPLLVPLPGRLHTIVDQLSSQWLSIASHIKRDEDRYGRMTGQRNLSDVLGMLWKEVCQPIAQALQKMGRPEGSRVWWCPVGRLGALPLHAAGIYNDKGVLSEGFPDLYVSSYTPTLSSLIASRATVVKGGSVPRLFAVGQSNSLPKVKDEFFKLRNLFPSHVLRVRDGERARSDTVLRDLRDHSWVHFACHGSLDASSPFKSGFILHDNKKLSLRDIMQARLPNAELAFLAACHSAAIESQSETPDEVLTLAAAMQFCGFRSIVGTLWTMNDSDGPVLTEKYYKHMLRNGLDHTDVRDSAEAVHLATKSMREAGVSLHRWTTFVHVGI